MLEEFPDGFRWQFYWESLKRFYYFYRDLYTGISIFRPLFSYLHEFDIVYAFFVSCYHLKDWISKDTNEDITHLVSDYVENTRLKDCQAIANGFKHLNIKKGPGIKGKKGFIYAKEGGQPRSVIEYYFYFDGEEVDAFELAKECMYLWRAFIKEKFNFEDFFMGDDIKNSPPPSKPVGKKDAS